MSWMPPSTSSFLQPQQQQRQLEEERTLLPIRIKIDNDIPPYTWRWSVNIAGLVGILTAVFVFLLVHFLSETLLPSPPSPLTNISVAFIGNSMMYHNDLPRFIEALSEGHLVQNGCFHGNSALRSILETGSGMYAKFNTTNALLFNNNSSNSSDHNHNVYYDFGACTVKQLLLGYDEELEQQVVMWKYNGNRSSSSSNRSAVTQDLENNPCIQDPSYLAYLDNTTFREVPHWDYILINDFTRNPGRESTRQDGLRVLSEIYVPWFIKTGATPIFLDTHAYWTDECCTEFINVPTFTSWTYQGYLQYKEMVSKLLPSSQTPLIAPVGIAFLTVWEEDRLLWRRLFYELDHLHASPSGTFLTGCVVFYTLFGRMPDRKAVLPQSPNDNIINVSVLWTHARVMQQAGDPPAPFPNFQEAQYLYEVADRVARRGYRPMSLTLSQNSEWDNE